MRRRAPRSNRPAAASKRTRRRCFGWWRFGSCSWAGAGTGDRQSIADIGQIIFEVTIFVGLRLQRHAANLAVAGGKTPADRAHAAPFGAIDRHRVQYPE